MIYICKRCCYETTRLSNFKMHINRKNICNDVNQSKLTKEELLDNLNKITEKKEKYVCKYCNKNFETSDKKYKHQKICKENNKLENINSENINLKLLDKINELEEKIKNIENQKPIVQNNYYNNSNNTITYNDNKNITNNFGEENLSHISFDKLTKYSSGLNDGFREFIENIHFSKDMEENMNIRMKTKDIIEVVNNGKWIEKDCSNTIDRIIGVGRKILFRHFIENKDKEERLEDLSEVLQQYYTGLMNASNDYHKLKRELYFVIKNNTIYLMENTTT